MNGPVEAAEAVLLWNHWQWRPEWAASRPNLMWYLTLENQPSLTPVLEQTNRVMRDLHYVDVVPRKWLHLTLQDVGFVDELDVADVNVAVNEAWGAVHDLGPLKLTLGPITTDESAVVLDVAPNAALRSLRTRLRAANAAAGLPVRGPRTFRPHVSLGYINRDSDEEAVREALQVAQPPSTVDVTIRRLTLAAVTRDDRHYQWTQYRGVSFDGRWRAGAGNPPAAK
jgi:2'-5' RNA ligase